jgi:hypothetical protein
MSRAFWRNQRIWGCGRFCRRCCPCARRAGADEFAVCGSKREEHGVVEFFVVWDEVEFISVNDVEFWSAYGFRVVRVRFYAASVGEGYRGFLRLLVGGFGEFGEEAVYVFDYEFGLSPAWSDYADVCVGIC